MKRVGCLLFVTLGVLGCGGSEPATGNGGVPGTGGGSGSSSGGSAGKGGTAGSAGSAAGSGAMDTGGGGSGMAGGGAGGTDAGSGGDAGSSGAAGSSGTAGSAGRPSATCSENPIRTAPPAGKEMFRTDPIDTRFPFSTHWIGVFSDSAADEATRYISMTSTADLDHDGDLDFATGQRHSVGGGMVWWEYCGPDHWVRHAVGTGHTSAAGGNAADVDGDGWVDLLAGNSWYRNPAPPAGTWMRHEIGAPGAEELIVGDVTSSERPDVLYVWNSINPQFWTAGSDPTAMWTRTELTTDTSKREQQGGAIADIDGDERNDIVVGHEWWYRNVNADGRTWEAVPLLASNAFDNAPLTHVGDIDGDGDTDVVMCTHFGSTAGTSRVAWVENDGTGSSWTIHPVASGKSFTHAIVAADFDNDDDLDIFLGQNVGEQWIFENDGQGAFEEHRIAVDSRGHEARVGDVDCDGDLDIMGKPWGQQNEGGEQQNPPRDHVYLRNMVVEEGGTPSFDRGPYEVLPATAMRSCP
jgi:hypothetical protein